MDPARVKVPRRLGWCWYAPPVELMVTSVQSPQVAEDAWERGNMRQRMVREDIMGREELWYWEIWCQHSTDSILILSAGLLQTSDNWTMSGGHKEQLTYEWWTQGTIDLWMVDTRDNWPMCYGHRGQLTNYCWTHDTSDQWLALPRNMWLMIGGHKGHMTNNWWTQGTSTNDWCSKGTKNPPNEKSKYQQQKMMTRHSMVLLGTL